MNKKKKVNKNKNIKRLFLKKYKKKILKEKKDFYQTQNAETFYL